MHNIKEIWTKKNNVLNVFVTGQIWFKVNFDSLQVDSYCLLALVDEGSIEDQPR